MTRTDLTRKLLFGALAAAFLAVAGRSFYDHRHLREPVVLGPGVTRVTTLSEFNPTIRGTANDANIYVLEGKEPGGTAFVFGGTHAEEPAGRLAAWLLVEHATIERGRLIVALSANRSASTVTRPSAAYPATYTIPTAWGGQTFRMGDRFTNPLDQWPDPEVFIHYPSGQYLAYVDVRNLNRAFPGRANGSLTERTTYAFMELIRREKVDVAIDLHEAELQYPVINTIVTHQKGQELATMISMTLTDLEGFNIGTEFSPRNLHGLTHREIGDHSPAVSLLFEAPEPFLDATRGRTERRRAAQRTGRVRGEGRQEGAALRADRREGVAHRHPRRAPHLGGGADARDLDRVQRGPRDRGEEHSALRGPGQTRRRPLPARSPAGVCRTASPTNRTCRLPSLRAAAAFRPSAAGPSRPGTLFAPLLAGPSAAAPGTRNPGLCTGWPRQLHWSAHDLEMGLQS